MLVVGLLSYQHFNNHALFHQSKKPPLVDTEYPMISVSGLVNVHAVNKIVQDVCIMMPMIIPIDALQCLNAPLKQCGASSSSFILVMLKIKHCAHKELL